jgi:hypothetical protein
MTQAIFVIGSKPDAIFPAVVPSRIYAANGATARAQPIASEHDAPLTAVVWKIFFAERKQERHAATAAALDGCRGDRLVISGGGPKNAQYDPPRSRGLIFRREQHLSRLASLRLKLRYASLSRVFNDVLSDLGRGSSKGIFDQIRRKRSVDALGISTGLLATLLALDETAANSRIYVIGIGIDEDEGQFYDSGGLGRFRHVKADKAMVRDLVRKVPGKRLVFTDPKFAAFTAECRQSA